MANAVPSSIPTADDLDDLILSCRYGDLEDVQAFQARFGPSALADARDANHNTVLHMAAANGHTELLEFLLAHTPPALVSAQNAAGSTPLHWAALNKHLEPAQRLVAIGGATLIDIKNSGSHTPLGEAENAGWDEGAKWMVQVMTLDNTKQGDVEAGEEETAVGADVEVEIEDADGQVARMTLGSDEPARQVDASATPSVPASKSDVPS